jgi:hypothetical protein
LQDALIIGEGMPEPLRVRVERDRDLREVSPRGL